MSSTLSIFRMDAVIFSLSTIDMMVDRKIRQNVENNVAAFKNEIILKS